MPYQCTKFNRNSIDAPKQFRGKAKLSSHNINRFRAGKVAAKRVICIFPFADNVDRQFLSTKHAI